MVLTTNKQRSGEKNPAAVALRDGDREEERAWL
jgi:hypothetical protein